ncbi:MAG: SDR family NAD(P)-dependent oxidoreductase [Clostridia bacterium]|nr:SDR family NAD(P)-dependent oxidoreductase [Clostridia bacterium]
MMEYTFISGATGGIGKAFAYQLASKGAPLFLTGRDHEKLCALKEDIVNHYGVDVSVFACDLTNENSRAQMVDYIRANDLRFCRIVHVAGVDTQMPFMEYKENKVLMQIRVNAEATIFLTRALLNFRASDVEVICISSMSGQTPMPYFALYSASKAMLTNFFTSLHYELKKDRVKVTTIIPGGVYTRHDVIEQIKGQGLWGKLTAKQPEFIAKKSLIAVRRNKVKYIPGFFNRFLNVIMKILPKKLVLSFIAKRWKKERKDAF